MQVEPIRAYAWVREPETSTAPPGQPGELPEPSPAAASCGLAGEACLSQLATGLQQDRTPDLNAVTR